ncbi:hypothetical protein N7478_001547 [Penicillium angulare]|uniref:uncharacterized protein n=1 Tax=Penicillium angulare TaxID=116970 RepID=UPI00253F9003|nr:uncharacterized protein N7478_001547 [Penicillium angulare]KAJ5288517.1 hypothetical protein N7478_001547 [Penicillium angulare]
MESPSITTINTDSIPWLSCFAAALGITQLSHTQTNQKRQILGPRITASLHEGLCQKKTVHLSRKPLVRPSRPTAWSVLLAVIHSDLPAHQDCGQTRNIQPGLNPYEFYNVKSAECIITITDVSASSGEGWDDLEKQPLVQHKLARCTVISRTTLMTLLCVVNAQFLSVSSTSAGYFAFYTCYTGQWGVEWPIGDKARVYFSAHESGSFTKDVYPALVEQRVDKCLQMLAGVIDCRPLHEFMCAFPGRETSGNWVLRYVPREFRGAHGGSRLYTLTGGNVDELDYLHMRTVDYELGEKEKDGATILHLPNKYDGSHDVRLYVGPTEAAILNEALDCLPWNFLSWSIHRGMRDILLAFAKERMDQHRGKLAATLGHAVTAWSHKLEARGWDSSFVTTDMGNMAMGAIMAGSGDLADLVRIVTDIALILWDGMASDLDKTTFWSNQSPSNELGVLSPMAIIALVKVFVLEWSVDLDYQMYHDLPTDIYLG